MNHNGDIDLAKRLVREAKNCGADCVKFQTFKAERVVTINAPKASYQLKTTDPSESQINMLKKLEMPEKNYQEIVDYCRELDIVFISTPYNVEDVDFLDKLGVPAFKLASMHIVEPYFIDYTAKKGKPVILSTGMATLEEVDQAVCTLRESGNDQFILLQCTTNYPSRLEDANLRAIHTIRNAFDALVGYSDHTQNDIACIVSVALGANVVEKHFTLDKTLPGPDQSSSYDPEEFARLVENIRNAEKVLGSDRKKPCEIEKINAEGMRRSVVAKDFIREGTIITQEMLTFKRPATGLPPSYFHGVIGKKALRRIEADSPIQWDDLER